VSLSPAERFARHIVPIPEAGCWLWDGFLVGGYGRLRMTYDPSDPTELAHRASWILHRGQIPKGMMVCHRCDVRSCVNPSHLFLGTATDNMSDAARKGRMNWKNPERPALRRCERHPQAKLTNDQVREIRASDLSGIVLAKKYGVSNNSITRIRLRHTWRDLPSVS
jgi:hypothetical protein